jgi:hypothetical protein
MFEETYRLSTVLGDYGSEDESSREHDIASLSRWTANGAQQKIFLPRGSAESRFAPRQYYYLASKSGVIPSWAAAAQDESRH